MLPAGAAAHFTSHLRELVLTEALDAFVWAVRRDAPPGKNCQVRLGPTAEQSWEQWLLEYDPWKARGCTGTPLAKRRHIDPKDMKPIVEIFSEGPLLDPG